MDECYVCGVDSDLYCKRCGKCFCEEHGDELEELCNSCLKEGTKEPVEDDVELI